MANDGKAGDLFGVSVDSNTILVGADLNDQQAHNAGAVYVYVLNENEWHQKRICWLMMARIPTFWSAVTVLKTAIVSDETILKILVLMLALRVCAKCGRVVSAAKTYFTGWHR